MLITYTNDAVRFNMPGYVRALPQRYGTGGANPAPTPLPIDFALSKLDAPATDEQFGHVIEHVNKTFNQSFSTFKEVKTLYQSIVSSLSWR